VPSVDSADLVPLLAAAGGMVLVIFSESLGAADAFALEHGYQVDANQELIALGAANAGSGLLSGLAGGGSLSQSAVNAGAGARSEMSALLAAVLILVTVLLLTPLFKELPEAVLAALIIHAVAHLWKVAALRRVYAERHIEFALGLATLLGVLTLDVLPGLVIGVLSMLLLLIYNASRPHVAVLGRLPAEADVFVALDRRPEAEPIPGLLVVRLEAPLVYANAAPVRDRVKRLVGEADPTPRAVVLQIGANDDLDITAAQVLEELVRSLHAAGIDFAIAAIRDPVIARARLTGLLAEIGEDRVFHTVEQAVEAVEARV
jgi:MFS superfamily sulfate permease-like transporter